MTARPPSVRLLSAAELVGAWSEPYAEPLAELLRAEAGHAGHLERDDCGWDRYPPGACLLRIADGVLADHLSRTVRAVEVRR